MEEVFGCLCIQFRANYSSKQIKNILMVLEEINKSEDQDDVQMIIE